MNLDELKKAYPKLTAKVEDIDDLKSLVVVDENYDDEEADDSVDFDTDEFNYMVYVTEATQNAVGEEVMEKISTKFEKLNDFDDFLASEIDLFGVQTDLDENEIAKVVLNALESELA